MSVGFIGSKHTVYDIYPLHQKKVFLLVDPQNIMGGTADFNATLDTIAHLLNKQASVVIGTSFGPIAGISINTSKREREMAVDVFRCEGGMGYCNFFANLPPAAKLEVLRGIPGLELEFPGDLSSPNTGETTLFGSLSNDKKAQALKRKYGKKEFIPSSTHPFVDALQGRFPGVKVHFSPDCLRAPLHTVAPGEIMVLENLRFYRNELSQDQEERQAMAEVLAAGLDLFINDSFGTAFGEYASSVELPRLMQHGAAGQSMDRELAFYSKFLSHPGRPLAVVIAGSGVAGKLQLIRSLVGRADRIFVAGAVAYPFLVAKGLSCGLGYSVDNEPTIRVDGRDAIVAWHQRIYGSDGHHGNVAGLGKRGSKGNNSGTALVPGAGAANAVKPHHNLHANSHINVNAAGIAAAAVASDGGGRRRGSAEEGEEELVASAAPGSNITGDTPRKGGGPAGDVSGVGAGVGGHGEYRAEIPCSVYAREILDLCELYDVEIILPIDHIVTTNPDGDRSRAVLVESTAIPPGVYSMDCGINTINFFARCLMDCRTVLWMGALGWASKGYTNGTSAFAAMLGQSDIISIVGGRYTSQVVQESGVAGKILHVSSGGIASLEVLHGNPLPGVEALSDVAAPQAELSVLSINELVRHLPMFIGCNSHQLKVIAKKFVRRQLSKGDHLLYRGDRHVCLTLVAQGGLVARYSEEYTSAPARYIARGMTAGTYSFITQAPAMETIRAAQNDTIVYQLFSSALNELLNAHPDLAAQLFQNLSEPLRVIANEDYQKQQSTDEVAKRNGCRTRVPVLATIPARSGTWDDTVQDLISTVALQRVTMRYTPYVPVHDFVLPQQLTSEPPTPFHAALQAVSRHQGLGIALASSVLRNFLYHRIVATIQHPNVAAVVSAALVAPLRLLAYGIQYRDLNFKLMLDEGLIDAAAAVAPMVAYRAALQIQVWIEKHRKRRLGAVARALLMVLVKLLLGFAVFPVIYQRNFVYTQPSASRFWDHAAFQAYELKQVLALLLRYTVHKGLKLVK